MSYNRVDRSLFVIQNKPLDAKLGPWASTAEAIAAIGINRRYQGLIVEIIQSGSVVEYWWRDGVEDNDLIIKSGGSGVPYTGATQDVDLGEYELKAGQIEFDQTPTGTAGVAVLRWNDTDGTLDLGLKGGNVTLQIGQEQVQRVVNKTGANLLESGYKVVRIRRVDEGGSQGQRLAIVLAQGNNDANSVDTLGLVTENIDNNQEGFITTSGLVRGINTTGSLQGETWNDGDLLYLSPTTAGALTKVKPTAPQHTVIIGYVVYSHNNQGKIFVKVDNGYELEELHNVTTTNYTTPIDADSVLTYDNTNSLWKKLTWANLKSTLKTYFDTLYQVVITGAASTITTSNLTASRVLVSDSSGKVAASSVTSTTLGYLDATSSIQTQLDSKITGYTSPLASIASGGSAAETTITSFNIPAGYLKTGDNILYTVWGARTSGASTGVNSTLNSRVTDINGTLIFGFATGNRHHNYTLTGRVLSDTSIIWWQNSPTTASVTTTVPSLASSGFTINLSVVRDLNTSTFTLYNAILRKYN